MFHVKANYNYLVIHKNMLWVNLQVTENVMHHAKEN